MERKKCGIGDKVWWIKNESVYTCGIIRDIRTNDKEFAYIAEEGKIGEIEEVELEKCWPTIHELMRAVVRESINRTKEYKDQIKTVEDLIRFMYTHDVVTEDKDYDAEAAVQEKARELLGIDLS